MSSFDSETQIREVPIYQPGPAMIKDGIQTVLDVIGTSEMESEYRDSVLVAIDFENTANFDKSTNLPIKDVQVGLAILDPTHLSSSTSSEHLIPTYNFVAGSAEYRRKAELKFLFGKPVVIDHCHMLTSIMQCIPLGRKVLLVGHDIRHEIRILRQLKFDFSRFDITGSLDTFRIAQQVLPYFSLSLGELLTELQCPHNWLHNGGNEAHFTLRALLLLAERSCPGHVGINNNLSRAVAAARLPMPHISPGEAEMIAQEQLTAARKREKKRTKRIKNTRKYQSKSWGPEIIEQIRAGRAAKKLNKEKYRPIYGF
ncbi:hypothetical protein Trisim1_008345 [Trichoderma cf. simile WF8]